MSALVFLGGALALFLLVAFISWLRFRERTVKYDSSISSTVPGSSSFRKYSRSRIIPATPTTRAASSVTGFSTIR